MSVVIMARETDARSIRIYQKSLATDLVDRLLKERIIGAAADAVVREGLPETDHGLAQERWVTGALVANAYNTYVNHALGATRYCAFYGVANRSSTPGVSSVQYQLGAGGANTVDVAQVESMYVELMASCYLDTPVLYKPNETIFIRVYAQFVATEQVVLRNLVAEPSGGVSAPRLETRMIGGG